MNSELAKGFRLGHTTVEPLKGQITGPSGSRRVEPIMMRVLVCLADNDGRLVTHEDLMDDTWGEGQANLATLDDAVHELRRALGDDPDSPEFIQAVPGRGYRLLVEPMPLSSQKTETPGDDPAADKDSLWTMLMRHGVVQAALAYLVVGWLIIQVADATFEPVGLPSWSLAFITFVVIGGFPIVVLLAWFLESTGGKLVLDRGSQSGRFFQGLERNYLAIVAAYGIATVGAGIYQYTVGFNVPDAGEAGLTGIEMGEVEVHPNSVAVLKFINIDGSERTKIFSDGLSEDVLDKLATVPGLLVSSRGDSWSLPASAPSDLVRRRLRVAFFVEGSVRMVEDTLRVVVQLIDSRQGFHVVSRSFERDVANFMGLQREITSLIVANLRIALPEDALALAAAGSDAADIDAYVLYRQGMDLLHQPSTSKTLGEAIGFFDAALELDSGYPAAHAGLCQAYVASYELGNDAGFIEPAESACGAALATNSKLHVVYSALGHLYDRTGRYEEGRVAYERALEINPNSVAAMQGLASILENQQQLDEAEALLVESARLQPGNWRSMNSLGGFFFANGRYEEAAEAYRMIIALDPSNWQGLGNLGSALLMTGEFEDAAVALQNSIEIERDRSNLSNLAIIYYYLGRFDESVEIHEESVALFPESAVAWLNLADSLLFSSGAAEAGTAYRRAAELAEENLAIDSKDPMTLCRAAWANAMIGESVKSEGFMQRATRAAPANPYVHYYDALLKTRRGDLDGALDALGVAIENGYPPVMLVAEPLLTDLQGSDRFSALVVAPQRENSDGE